MLVRIVKLADVLSTSASLTIRTKIANLNAQFSQNTRSISNLLSFPLDLLIILVYHLYILVKKLTSIVMSYRYEYSSHDN